jgi:hypothetical protein
MKYRVSIEEVIQRTCIVEANSTEAAATKGYELMINGNGEHTEESLGTDNLSVTVVTD